MRHPHSVYKAMDSPGIPHDEGMGSVYHAAEFALNRKQPCGSLLSWLGDPIKVEATM